MRPKDWIYPEASEIDTVRDLRIISNYLPRRGRVLDAGGGVGRIAIPLAEKGLRVTLLDISKTALKLAKRRAKRKGVENLIEFVEGDVCELEFEDNTFDLVLALRDVVNYAYDRKKAAKELVRVLKPGGYLIASVSNRVFWLTKLERWGYNLEKVKSLLVTESMLTEKELRKLFKEIRVEKVLGSGYCSGNLPSKLLTKDWFEIEETVGNSDELKFACEYLVLVGRKRG